MSEVLELTVGDTAPTLTFTVNADITGATLEIHVRRPDGTTFTRPAGVVDGPAGRGSSTLTTGNLNQAGRYYLEVQVTFSGGAIQTFRKKAGRDVSFLVGDQIA